MYIFFICLFSVICLAVMPFFLLEQRNPSVKSLLLKMVCATGFLMAGIFARSYAGGGTYAMFMVIGLACSWFGDFGLHAQGKAKFLFFVLGTLGFLAAHVMYLLAYNEKLQLFRPDAKFVSARDACIILTVFAVYMGILLLTKTTMSPLMIPLSAYIFFLTLMCIKAITLASYIKADSLAAALLLGCGSVCFLLSDTSLGLLIFNKKLKPNFPLKIFNIATYFVAQLMLAATILFIR